MNTDQRQLPWIDRLLRQSHAEFLARRAQIEMMLEDGALLAPLFFDKSEGPQEAVSFQSRFGDDSDTNKTPVDRALRAKRHGAR